MKNKVFFNNSCNICRAEINHYKKHSNQDIEWVDVTNNKEAQQITSKSYEQLLRRMHVIQDGKLIEGAEVFLIIWKNIPKYNFLYKLFNLFSYVYCVTRATASERALASSGLWLKQSTFNNTY